MRGSNILAITLFLSGCNTVPGDSESSGGVEADRAAANHHATVESPPKAEFLTLADRKFTSPGDGTTFHLTLGPSLETTEGVTKIPEGIIGMRQATASFYKLTSKDGGSFGAAECSISEDFADRLDQIKIQYEPESQRILVTENMSDALPCKRYILFTPMAPGYKIEYLKFKYQMKSFAVVGSSPGSPQVMELPGELPQVILMPGDRAWVDGEIVTLADIPKSNFPFSSGG